MNSNLFVFFSFIEFFCVSGLRALCLTTDHDEFLLFFLLKIVWYYILYLDLWSILSCFSHIERAFSWSSLFFWIWCPIVPTTFIEKTLHSPLNCLCTFVEVNWPYLCRSVSWLSFCFIDLWVYPFSNTTVSWLLWYYVKSWSQIVSFLSLHSFFFSSFCYLVLVSFQGNFRVSFTDEFPLSILSNFFSFINFWVLH